MSQRLDEFNNRFVYTETNPEGIISAKKNALFFRSGTNFYVNYEGYMGSVWEKLPYETVIIPPPDPSTIIQYEYPYELWVKTTDGFYDQFSDLLPKTGWQFVGYQDVFANANPRTLTWILPPPINSNDLIGSNKSRSYDENYFYAKIDNKWLRTPITTFDSSLSEGIDRPELSTNLPYIDYPRHRPVPVAPNSEPTLDIGEQSYDVEYFYIKPSGWKRTRLNIYYDVNKMARF